MTDNISYIDKWLSGKNVFITGGTGFMGKVLVEKLLRCVPSLGKLYLLVRPKRGLTPEKRLEQIVKLPVFERIQEECPNVLKKIVILEGNLLEENLGFSPATIQTLINEVSIVFHMGASLRLEAEVKDAILANTQGTKTVMELCKKLKKIECVLHLSTAFCHADVLSLEEKMYSPIKDPLEIIKLVQTETNEYLMANKERIIAPHPNSYTFSKRLAETIVESYEDCLPVVILRPSIVLPAFKEPMPGWVDSLNGPIGILVASGKGVLRSMLCKGEYNAQVIPVDIAINGIMIAAYARSLKKENKVLVAHATAPKNELTITWNEIMEKSRKVIKKYPFEWMLWYPSGNMTQNVWKHFAIVILFQWFPAILLDGLFFVLRRERFMIRVQKKIFVGTELLKYFTLNKWEIAMDRSVEIVYKYTKGKDAETFQLLNNKYDVDDFILKGILGARIYCMKENVKTLKYSRIHLFVLMVLHHIVKFFFWYFIVKYICNMMGLGQIFM